MDLLKQGQVRWDLLNILIRPVPPTGEQISPKVGLIGTYKISPEGLIPPSYLCSPGDGSASRTQRQLANETFHSRRMMVVKINMSQHVVNLRE